MFRARRYRVLLAFAAVFLLALVHFARHRDGSTITLDIPPLGDHHSPPPPSPPDPVAPDSPHGFSPESSDSNASEPSENTDLSEESSNVSSEDAKLSTDDSSKQSSSSSSHDSQSKDESKLTSHGHGRLDIGAGDTHGPQLHWEKPVEHFPLAPEDIIKLPTGTPKELPRLQASFKDESTSDKMSRLDRLDAVKAEFEHAWNGYKASAMGHDEIKPQRGGYRDPFMGWGATLVDTLDTLWIMDLKEEFAIAVDQVKKIDFTTSKRHDIPIFETTIRYLGGLLSAYDLSGHKYEVLLQKAIELADILIGAFDTPNRMPTLFYNWTPDHTSRPHHADSDAVLAELGSLSVEFTRLAQLTKEDKYYDAIARITNELEVLQGETVIPGVWPTRLDASGCRNARPQLNNEYERAVPSSMPTPVQDASDAPKAQISRPMPTDAKSYENFLDRREADGLHDDAQPADYDQLSVDKSNLEQYENRPTGAQSCTGGLSNQLSHFHKFSLAALADSTYEYLPKEYMLLGGLNEQYHSMYERAMNVVREQFVYQPMVKGGRDIRFLASAKVANRKTSLTERTTYTYEGTHLGCFAGGMVAMGSKLFGIEQDMELAAQLTDGCVWAYEATKTGIMPEQFLLLPCEKGKPCEWSESKYWLALDPHTEERNARINELKAQKQREPPQPKSGGNSIHGKREWHVIATSDDDSKEDASKSSDGDDKRSISDSSHEEYVMSRIQSEHLPPGMVNIPSRKYILRPEAIESVFIMYRMTGDEYWREKGWRMFQAISKYTRTEFANSAIDDVTVDHPQMKDEMESFWLGETLKYFYLLFSDPSLVSLDEFVL
ncbi:glycosyl hydrolase family 47-domain-containing protein [Aspergillus ambiguus]|uniref:class I alpha-mannosidase 1A n=1 Tax=Aspergillus ambiguus TaxID=176160 RepID=UPI003CCD9A44